MLYRMVSSSEAKGLSHKAFRQQLASESGVDNVFAGMIVGKYIAVYAGTGGSVRYGENI